MVRWSQAIIDNWYSVLESHVIYSFYIFIDSSCEINSLLEYQLAVGLTKALVFNTVKGHVFPDKSQTVIAHLLGFEATTRSGV